MRESRYRRQNAKRAVVRELKNSVSMLLGELRIQSTAIGVGQFGPINLNFRWGDDVTVATQKKRGKGFYVFPCDGRYGVTYTDATFFSLSLFLRFFYVMQCGGTLKIPEKSRNSFLTK